LAVSERAGKPAEASMLVDVDRLVGDYYDLKPDPNVPAQAVAFGTSGHRGSSFNRAFNEDHILATTEAICRYRQRRGTTGPLFIGKDSHALSGPATRTAVEVLVANGVSVRVDVDDDGLTPTPSVSHAILTYNRGRSEGLADGIVVTPSHNPPEDGGFKYNPTNGGPADTDVTNAIQREANDLLRKGVDRIPRLQYERAWAEVERYNFCAAYVADLASVIDMDAIRASRLHLGVDPLGGASVAYWAAIRDGYQLDLTVTNEVVDPTFGFMTVDWDGRIRMDPSSPYAMARLVALKDRFDVAFANDTDADRHGIVSGAAGLMNPNHFLSAAVAYLYRNRDWRADVAVGKTLVSTGMLDRVTADLGRRLLEVPVGFKWFVSGLVDGTLGFGGEESAGASFLRRYGTVWSTDKDGLIACLLAAELAAKSGRDPAAAYSELTARFGAPAYRRIDAPATPEQKAVLARLSPTQVKATQLAGEPITAVLTRAPGNDAPIGGVKVTTEHGWFAARPSGTENVYKVYAESFRGETHLKQIIGEAQTVVTDALAAG
jgi:phosphoglucomutase